MPAAVLALLVLLALLLPVAPFAINHGARQIHARRHAACLHRIAQLEYDLGMYSPDSPRPAMRTAAQAAQKWQTSVSRKALNYQSGRKWVAPHSAGGLSDEQEKAWAENRKRTVQEIRDRYYREGH